MPILRERTVWQREPKKKRLRSEHLDAEQEANVVRALVFLGKRHGGLNPLSRHMGAARTTVTRAVHGHRRISAALALRVAKIAGVSLADVLDGRFPRAGQCPMCGRHLAMR
jgi:hypothetical protein